MEYLIVLTVVSCFIVSLFVREVDSIPQPCIEVTVSKSKPKSQRKSIDPNINEAKKMLVEMGYTTTEAKVLLRNVQANSVEEYISQAMNKVKL